MNNSLSIPVRTAIIYALVDVLPESELSRRAESVVSNIMMLASFPSPENIEVIVDSSESIVNELFSAYVAKSGKRPSECARSIKESLCKNGISLPEGHSIGKVAAARL